MIHPANSANIRRRCCKAQRRPWRDERGAKFWRKHHDHIYNPVMPSERALLSRDTSREAEEFQILRWRSLSTTEIAQLVTGASQAARTLAFAGLRARYPDAPDHELVPLFALLTLGPALARQAYPDLDRRLGRPAS